VGYGRNSSLTGGIAVIQTTAVTGTPADAAAEIWKEWTVAETSEERRGGLKIGEEDC
jgi:hypothetical protein